MQAFPILSSCLLLMLVAVQSVAQEAGQISSELRSYRISARDMLSVNIYDEAELSVTQRVDDNGELKLPLLPSFQVEGLSVSELEETIERMYIKERILRIPDVTVTVAQFAPRQAGVFGQVGSEGQVTFPPEKNEVSIIEIIGLAGGFSDIAKEDSVRVTRRMPDGTEKEFTVNVREHIDGRARRNQSKEIFMVQPGDVVFVPQRIF